MRYYFFTDFDKLLNQTASNAFGAITPYGNDSEKFQITSIHSCQSDTKACAICDGLIMIQPNNSDPNLVNIILKPIAQSIDNTPIAYFIYRGISKSSLFNNSLINLSGNDLCVLIAETINKLNQKYPAISHVPADYILAYGNVADADFLTFTKPPQLSVDDIAIDSIFNTKNLQYKPFKIKGGAYIGNLNAEFGIDIILNDVSTDIAEARLGDNFITSQNFAGLNDIELFNEKSKKETALSYFDICQFYILTYDRVGLWIKNSTANDFSEVKKSNQIIDILSKFNNRTFLFLDIRNEFNNSLNYQNNITAPIGIKKDNGNYTYLNYPDWPLLKIDIQSVTNIYIKIPKSDFENVRAYFRESNKDSFSFKAINFDGSNYSTEFRIKTIKSPSQVTLPSYLYFMFLREIDEDLYPTEWVINPQYFIDTLFDVENLIYTDANENLYMYGLTYYTKSSKWKIYEDNKYVDSSENSFIAKIGVAEDISNIYFFAFSNGDSLQTGAADIPILSGESDEEHFLEGILFPKLNNAISLYSRKINQGGNDIYILNDNINYINTSNSAKLIQNKNNFVLIGIDKQENVVKLKNAYLQFANNHPKRLVIREKTEITDSSGKKHWEASIFLIGYGNDTITNSFKIKEINTEIKLIFAKDGQRVIGTNKFNEAFVKTPLEINGENFYGKMLKNIRYNFRTFPDYTNETEIVFEGGRRDIYFKVLGKCQSPQNPPPNSTPNMTWYYIELLEDERDFDEPYNEDIKGKKGERYFISKESSPVIFAKFDAFIEELIHQNSVFDNATNGSQNDTVAQRITRFRQRGHNADVSLFNDVIGTTVVNPVYLDQIPYELDDIILLPQETGPGFPITNRLQLYRDFEIVEFSNGKAAEIQHMFVGLDVIGNLREDFTVYYIGWPIDVPNNVHFSLHSGDAGTVPNPVFNLIDNDPGNQAAILAAIEALFNQDIPNNRQLNPIVNRYYQHYLNTRFGIYDRYGNIYGFGLYYQLHNTIWINSNPSFQLKNLFADFNSDMSTSESDSIRFFYDFFSCDLNQMIGSNTNVPLYNDMRKNTVDFSIVWRQLEQVVPIVLPSTKEVLEHYSYLAIQEHVNLINSLRSKYF